MKNSKALVPQYFQLNEGALPKELLVAGAGVVLLSLLAQVSFLLPWTPVPITGQTFGVAFIALNWGFSRSIGILAAYLLLGHIGLPIFSAGSSGLVWGPTLGYLIGLFFSSALMGSLVDRGFVTSLGRAYLACLMGSVVTFLFGLFVLSFFVPKEGLLMAGLIPFLPGDFLKSVLAAGLTRILQKSIPSERRS